MAHYLRKLGVGPESLVGVLLERSTSLIVALLGVLKSGASYVPLDPAYPSERLRFMLEDAGARVLLTQESLQNLLPPHDCARCLSRYGMGRHRAREQRESGAPDDACKPGLCDLHLGFDRQTQRRSDRTSQRRHDD